MNTDALGIGLGLIFFGAFFFGFLIWQIRGHSKRWWARPSHPRMPGGEIYWGVPGSVAIIFTGVALLMPTLALRQTLAFILTLWFPLAFVFLIWRPRFLTPKWLIWLRDNHGEIMGLLEEEAERVYRI